MFTVSDQTNVYCILNNWCICIDISCGSCVVLVGGADVLACSSNNDNDKYFNY